MSIINYDNLSKTRDELINEITTLNNDDFNKSEEISWSIAQICQHLVLTEEIFTKVIGGKVTHTYSNTTERKNIYLIMDRTKKIEAPEIVHPDAEPKEVQQIIDLLSSSRTQLLHLLDTVKDESILEKKSAKHPVFGVLPLVQWIELIYLHEQRHIEQIKELKLSI